MSLYPILWAAEHAPIYDAEERAILVALVMKGDFDGCNCFRSYRTLANAARIDRKTVERKCHAMEARGILRRQTRYVSPAWRKLPEKQRPVVWEVMIPAEWWGATQLREVNEQREALGRPIITTKTRPALADAPPKKERADKGKRRPRKTATATDPGTTSPGGDPGTTSPHPGDYKSPPRGLQVPQPSESPSESPSDKNPGGSAGGQSAGGFARAGGSSGAAPQEAPMQGGCAADPKKSPARKHTAQKLTEARPVAGEDAVWEVLDAILTELGQRPGSRPPTLRKAVRLFLGHDTDARGGTAFALHPRRPEHAIVRLNRGWYRARGPERSAAGYDGPDPIRRPVGYLAQVLTVQDCLRPECEQGVLLTTGVECGECEQAKVERIGAAVAVRLERETAEAAAQQEARAGQFGDVDQHQDQVLRVPEQRTTWHCETATCRRPGRGAPPEVPLCDECLEDLHLALAGAANGPERP